MHPSASKNFWSRYIQLQAAKVVPRFTCRYAIGVMAAWSGNPPHEGFIPHLQYPSGRKILRSIHSFSPNHGPRSSLSKMFPMSRIIAPVLVIPAFNTQSSTHFSIDFQTDAAQNFEDNLISIIHEIESKLLIEAAFHCV